MIIHGINGETVEIRSAGYQFPGMDVGEYDANWLMIYLKVNGKERKWDALDPSLETMDLEAIIDWFERLSVGGKVKYRELGFMEPNLSFKILEENDAGELLIRIQFELELKPKDVVDDLEVYVDFLAGKEELMEIADEFRWELEKYPRRG